MGLPIQMRQQQRQNSAVVEISKNGVQMLSVASCPPQNASNRKWQSSKPTARLAVASKQSCRQPSTSRRSSRQAFLKGPRHILGLNC
eukprot:6475022-Amphidinium_carterae.1